MPYLEYINDTDFDESSVLTVGTFDGVHVGHRAILTYLMDRAAHLNGRSTVVTFDPHPREIVGSGSISLLTTVEERAAICQEIGIDRFVVIRFDEAFSKLSPGAFVSSILMQKVGMREMVIGHDHHFGHGRTGNENLLLQLSDELNFDIDVVPAQILNNTVVSSSEIRRLISEEGKVTRANEQLGYSYSLTGVVVTGLGRGSELGFPTANQEQNQRGKLVPANGVYAVRVSVDDDKSGHVGMMNIGHRPTFENAGLHLEVHLLDYDQDLYEKELRVEFLSRIRSEKKFENIQELTTQLRADRERCIAFAATGV